MARNDYSDLPEAQPIPRRPAVGLSVIAALCFLGVAIGLIVYFST